MIDHDDETLIGFLEESLEHLDGIEDDLISMEENSDNLDPDLVNKVFRAAHTIKGTSGFFGFTKIKELAHVMENVLGLIRNNELKAAPDNISALLKGADLLRNMISDIDNYESVYTDDAQAELKAIEKGQAIKPASGEAPQKAASAPAQSGAPEGAGEGAIPVSLPGQPPLFGIDVSVIAKHQYMEKGGKFIYLLYFEKPLGEIAEPLKETSELGVIIDKRDLEDNKSAVVCSSVVEPSIFLEFMEFPDCTKALLSDRLYEKTLAESKPSSAEPAKPEPAKPVAAPKPPPPTPKPPPAADRSESAKKPAASDSQKQDTTSIRVNLVTLERLMVLAGELVLTRNALVKTTEKLENDELTSLSQQVDAITSEMQEAIMSTRMQTMGSVLGKFKRIVRDLSKNLDKEIDLTIEGEDVELDKTIIEAITDPLTHLVRNSVDHGIERPDERMKKGKARTGKLLLKAMHQAGQVLVEIADDGAGIDQERVTDKALEKGLITRDEAAGMTDKEKVMLIFRPGLSTAKAVTDVSGRGVGMDVVLTNLAKVGGVVDVNSVYGKGTSILIKLPLTLAIMPSILISASGQRYAIPQVNLVELIRVPASDATSKIEQIGQWPVMRLRGELLPLLRLSDILRGDSFYRIEDSGEVLPDRRKNIVDRRGNIVENPEEYEIKEPRIGNDRRTNSAVNILVVNTGSQHYGLIVDYFLDTEEIVVKPLVGQLSKCEIYAGATIMGDATVALILDIAGIQGKAGLVASQNAIKTAKSAGAGDDLKHDANSYLILKINEEEQLAIPIGYTSRIEHFKKADIVRLAGRTAVPYLESMLALISMDDVLKTSRPEYGDEVVVLIFKAYGKDIGLMASEVVDIEDVTSVVDTATHVQPGIMGSVVINGVISLIPDLHGMVDILMPEYKKPRKFKESGPVILVVEDSPFFLRQMKSFLNEAGYEVLTAENGVEGFNVLDNNADRVSLVLTDIEMPKMDGVSLTRKIRADGRFNELPVIAVTSLSDDVAVAKGREAGLTEYLIKLDRELILDRVSHYLETK